MTSKLNRSTFMNIPLDTDDPIALRRFLSRLVEQLDIAFDNRGIVTTTATVEDLTKSVGDVSAVGIEKELNSRALLSRIEELERKVSDLES